MGKWAGNIDIKKEWKELKSIEELPANQEEVDKLLEPLIDKLKAERFYTDDSLYKDLVDHLEDSSNWEEFNETWNQIYDWADLNKVFINTLF